MLSIRTDQPDPRLDLQYPPSWSRDADAGYNRLYPYRPLSVFRDRLVEEEEKRRVDAVKAEEEREQRERALLQPEEEQMTAKPVEVQVGERLAKLEHNRAFSSTDRNYSHAGALTQQAYEYCRKNGGGSIARPFRLAVAEDQEVTHTEVKIQELVDRHPDANDCHITGKIEIKKTREGELHREAEGFPATDAGIRNATQNVAYQTRYSRRTSGEGAPADTAMKWLKRSEQRLPSHANELQRMLGWRKAAAEMKRAEGDIASLRAQLGHRAADESGMRLLALCRDVCYCFSSERQHAMIYGDKKEQIGREVYNIVQLLEKGTSVHTIDERGQTCLHYCAMCKPTASNFDRVLELMELLIVKYGADTNAVDKKEEAPLHYAARCGNADTVYALVADFGAQVDADPNCRTRTPLHVAASCGHVDVVELLIEEGADVHATDSEGRTALQVADAAQRGKAMAAALSDGSALARKHSAAAEAKQRGGGIGGNAPPVEATLRRAPAARPPHVPPKATRELNDRNSFNARWGIAG